MRSIEYTTQQRPEPSEHPKQRTLSTSVGASDHGVHSWFHNEADLIDQDVSVGRYDGYLIEANDVLSFDQPAFCDGVHIFHAVARSVELVLINLSSDVLAFGEVIQNLLHFVHQASVASQLLDFLIGDDDAPDGLSEIDEKGRVADVVSSDGGRVRPNPGEIVGRARPEYRKTNNSIANHDCAVLDQHRVEDSHVQFLVDDAFAMFGKL